MRSIRHRFGRLGVTPIAVAVAVAALAACGNSPAVATGEGVRVEIVPGPNYRHEFPLFWFFSLRNAPQMVLWSETLDGDFIETLMVTRKLGTDGWSRAPGDETAGQTLTRPSAAPVWSYRSGRAPAATRADGVSASTADGAAREASIPLDAVTRATPKRESALDVSLPGASAVRCYLYLEVNHSTDFNDAYPVDALPGEPGYSGGPYGSGQPSLIYRASVDLLDPEQSDRVFTLVGHGSPEGSDGEVVTDLVGITTALQIVDEVRLHVDAARM